MPRRASGSGLDENRLTGIPYHVVDYTHYEHGTQFQLKRDYAQAFRHMVARHHRAESTHIAIGTRALLPSHFDFGVVFCGNTLCFLILRKLRASG